MRPEYQWFSALRLGKRISQSYIYKLCPRRYRRSPADWRGTTVEIDDASNLQADYSPMAMHLLRAALL